MIEREREREKRTKLDGIKIRPLNIDLAIEKTSSTAQFT